MVADVARFVRFVGKERFDLAALPRQADARASATELIRKDVTKQMVALIRRPRLVTLSGVGRLQWPSNKDIVARRMGRMVTAVGLGGPSDRIPRLGPASLQLQAFRVPRDLSVSSHTRDQLLRLSAAFASAVGHALEEEGRSPAQPTSPPPPPQMCPSSAWGRSLLKTQACGSSSVSWRASAHKAAWRGAPNWPNFGTCATAASPGCKVFCGALRHPRPGARGGRSGAALNGGRNVASSSPATKGTECLQLRRQPLAGDGHGARQLAGPRGRRPRHRDRVVPWREERLRKERQLDAADGCRGGGIRGAQADPQPVSNNAKR